MDALISTFHIDTTLLIAQVVNFAIVFTVLYFFALKPITKLMRERTAKIEQGIKDADLNQKKLIETQKDYEKTIIDAKKEAQEVFMTARKDAEAKKKEMLDAAKLDVAKTITDGKAELEREKVKMLADAKEDIVHIVIEAMKKTAGEKITESLDTEFIKSKMKEIA